MLRGFLLSLCWLIQVPPPEVPDPAAELRSTARDLETQETQELIALAANLARQGRTGEAREVGRLLPGPPPSGSATRFQPLPEVVPPARSGGLASMPSTARGADPEARGHESEGSALELVRQIRSKSAAAFFNLARKAATAEPPRLALADTWLRATLQRDPNHAEARRLLGYVPHEGGWARPFAVRQLAEGKMNHRLYGWIPAEWLPRLERGELPAPASPGQRRVDWLPAEQADQLRSDIRNPWKLATEHFELRSNAPLREAVELTHRLEAFYDLFCSMMADVIGESLPLARRFRVPSLTAEATYRPHQIVYFATEADYLDSLRNLAGPGIQGSLGYYNPPPSARGARAPAYFFRDPGGRLPDQATLFHEVSHQLLFETAGPHAYLKNAGNYWVFEGLGTFFETVVMNADGSMEVGGLVGARVEEALRSYQAGRFLPLATFVALEPEAFNRPSSIFVNYQQAMVLTIFLMQGRDQAYRASFLDYVKDAYRGRIKRGSGRSLQDRLGRAYEDLELEFREFLETEGGRAQGRSQTDPSDREGGGR
jgi:hypothetical protein